MDAVFVIEGMLVGGVALGFGFHELWSLKRLERRRRESERDESARTARERSGGSSGSADQGARSSEGLIQEQRGGEPHDHHHRGAEEDHGLEAPIEDDGGGLD